MGLDGGMWVEYRIGIDSIWTGVGLPRAEMAYPMRLGLSSLPTRGEGEGKEFSKVVKRAYYRYYYRGRGVTLPLSVILFRKSLQWHPDRWAGLGVYDVAVRGAFQLIGEAYEALMGGGIE